MIDKKYLRAGVNTKNLAAYLVDITDQYRAGSVPKDFTNKLEFAISPSEINRGLRASWGASTPLLSTNSYRQYSHSDREQFSLNGLILDTRCNKEDAMKYLDELEKYTRPTSTNFMPPILAFVWGERITQPIVLTSLSIKETAWVNGFVSRATYDMTFEYIQSRVEPKLPKIEEDTARQKKNPEAKGAVTVKPKTNKKAIMESVK